ncbi:S41 family peptidase [uncultured Pedobacter sp.]|nr:S41 family peptidase [uncultured Pedobacter sp.]
MNKKYFLILFTVSALAFGSCKKSKSTPQPVASRTELSLDSIFLYAKQVYYWNDKLPTYDVFNPRKYTTGSTDLDKYENELFGIAGYSLNKYDVYKNQGVYQNWPKYSTISDKTLDNPNPTATIIKNEAMAVDLSGNGNDVGLRVVSYLNKDGSYLPVITAVYGNSPADKAGVKRGWLISKIGSKAYGANYSNEKVELNAALAASSVSLELVSIAGLVANPPVKITKTVTLSKVSYKSSPIYAKKIFTAGAKKIGYLNFARFSVLSNPDGNAPSDNDLDLVFNEFVGAGVTDLIVDLRYNGGGYVMTAEYLINLIAPSSLTGKMMYAEYYNSTMQNRNATIMKNQPIVNASGKIVYHNGKIANYHDNSDYSVAGNTSYFNKKGSLNNIQNIVFLVTDNTASASELVINSLRPYLNVKLVGETTYGKPIGFFPVVIENRYEVYFSMFESKNANGIGGYYDGMKPDYDENSGNYPNLWDDISHDFGDPEEAYLAQALAILAPGVSVQSSGSGKISKATVMAKPTNILNNSKIVGKHRAGKEDFVGMIDRPKQKDK